MKHCPVREDYRRWLDAQVTAASATSMHTSALHARRPAPPAPSAPSARPAQPATLPAPLPTALPFAGYVVWCFESQTYLDIRFDHQRFEIVTQQVPSAAEAFYFDSLNAAYGHAAEMSEACLILFADAADAPVRVVG